MGRGGGWEGGGSGNQREPAEASGSQRSQGNYSRRGGCTRVHAQRSCACSRVQSAELLSPVGWSIYCRNLLGTWGALSWVLLFSLHVFERSDTRWHRTVPGPRGRDSRPSPRAPCQESRNIPRAYKNLQRESKAVPRHRRSLQRSHGRGETPTFGPMRRRPPRVSLFPNVHERYTLGIGSHIR